MTTQRSLSITTFSYLTENSPGTAIIVATFLNASQYKWIAQHGSVSEVVSDWATISNNWSHRDGAIWDKELPIRTGRVYYLQVRAGDDGAVVTSNGLGPWALSFTAREPRVNFNDEGDKVVINTDFRQGDGTGGINLVEIDYRVPGESAWRSGVLRNTDTGWSRLNIQWDIPLDARKVDTQFRARWGHEPGSTLGQKTGYGEYGSIEYHPGVPEPDVTPITDVPVMMLSYNDPAAGNITFSWNATSEPEAYIEWSTGFIVSASPTTVVGKHADDTRVMAEGAQLRARFFTFPKDGVPTRDGPWGEYVTVTWPEETPPSAQIAFTVRVIVAKSPLSSPPTTAPSQVQPLVPSSLSCNLTLIAVNSVF